MPPLGIVPYAGNFILGTTAPDAFEPEREASFSQHHFKKDDGRTCLPEFVQATYFMYQPIDDPAWSFTCGYYCHLWLDVYFSENSDRIPFKRPAGKSEAELRSLVRKETEILNAPFVLNLNDIPVLRPGDLVLPSSLGFVGAGRCIQLFYEVVEQSRAWSAPVYEFESIDPLDYAAFLEEASELFLNNIQKLSNSFLVYLSTGFY